MARMTLLLFLLISAIPVLAIADEGDQTVGWFHLAPATYGGYSFFCSRPGHHHLSDRRDRRMVHSWPSNFNPGNSPTCSRGATSYEPLESLVIRRSWRVESVVEWSGSPGMEHCCGTSSIPVPRFSTIMKSSHCPMEICCSWPGN